MKKKMKKWKKRMAACLLSLAMIPAGMNLSIKAEAVDDYRQWNQTDPEWNEKEAWPVSEYPTNTLPYMSQAGCLVTSIAQLLRHYDVIQTHDVNEFNPWICCMDLKKVNAFTSNADLELRDVPKAYPTFKMVSRQSYDAKKAVQLYKEGKALIIEYRKGAKQHFVAVSYAESADNIQTFEKAQNVETIFSDADMYSLIAFETGTGKMPDHEPRYSLDQAEVRADGFYIRGWCYDPDQTGSTLKMSISSDLGTVEINADQSRPDVDKAFGVGSNHGFEALIPWANTGSHRIKITLANIGIQDAVFDKVIFNKYLDLGDDLEAPVIEEPVLSMQEYGVDISASVKDNALVQQVQALMWLEGEEMPENYFNSGKEMKQSGGVYKTDFSFRDPGFEKGVWNLAVAAKDESGNISISETVSVDFSELPDEMVLYRVYNPGSGEHFYTARAAERNHLISLGWNDEGTAWTSPLVSSTPVYRLYNPNDGDHHYTTSGGERSHLISLGWKDEGIGWYSDPAATVPVYRQYNPNAKAGAHNFTVNKAENDHLVQLGWKEEGIAWFGL